VLGQIGGGFPWPDFMHKVVAGLVVTDVASIKLAIEIHAHMLQLSGAVGCEGLSCLIFRAPFALLRKERLIIGAVC
jgi:hypothetical protein